MKNLSNMYVYLTSAKELELQMTAIEYNMKDNHIHFPNVGEACKFTVHSVSEQQRPV